MKITTFDVPGLLLIEPKVFRDDRGYFFESYSQREFERTTGVKVNFVQDNQARSLHGVVRGLHFQKGEHAQAKLVRVVAGSVLDVAVDIREGSPTFGRHVAVELSADNFRQFYIPRGFAHGYAVLSDEAVFQYKTDNYYNPQSEGAIAWNDPELGIDWILPESEIILSEKDKKNPPLSDLLK